MIYLILFGEFFRTGLFSIGGGLASLPFLFAMADKYDWFTVGELADMVAVAESTPGPLGINMATYAGYAAAGVPGALVATVAMVLPPLLCSLLLCTVLAHVCKKDQLERMFWGLRPAVAGLIAAICFSLIELAVVNDADLGLSSGVDWRCLVLLLVLTLGMFRFNKLHPVLFIAVGAAVGLALGL